MSIKSPNLRTLLAMAFPMIVSQATETIMLFVDRLFLSWVGKGEFAAAMSGGLSSFVFVSFFWGTASYTNALVSQYAGARREHRCVQTATQGIYFSFLSYPFLLALIIPARYLFIAAGHTPAQVALEFNYFRILMIGGLFFVLRHALAGYFLGMSKTGIVMWANVIGMLVNIPLNYVFIFGKWGFPAMGINGAAAATIIGGMVAFGILFAAYIRSPSYIQMPRKDRWLFDRPLLRRLLRFGLPTGIEMFLNVFAFNIFIQLMHSMGPNIAAVVTIVFNYDLLAFIPMTGLGFAVTALVGQQMGAGSIKGAQETAMLSLRVGWSYACIMMMLFIIGAEPLVSVFTRNFSSSDASFIRLAVIMLRLASLYTLADITQLVLGGALRGAGDTRWVMIISAGIHWLLAVAAVIMIRVLHMQPLQIWIAFVGFALLLSGGILVRYLQGRWKHIQVIEAPLLSNPVSDKEKSI